MGIYYVSLFWLPQCRHNKRAEKGKKTLETHVLTTEVWPELIKGTKEKSINMTEVEEKF